MFIYIPPTGRGPTIGDILDALESITYKDFVLIILVFLSACLCSYFIIGHIHGFNCFGLKTISFLIGSMATSPICLIIYFIKDLIIKR